MVHYLTEGPDKMTHSSGCVFSPSAPADAQFLKSETFLYVSVKSINKQFSCLNRSFLERSEPNLTYNNKRCFS